MTTLTWLLPILLPLTAAGAALLPVGGRARGWLLPVAALPALAIGLVGPPAATAALPWALLDVRLEADDLTRVLLIVTALVWAAAGASARAGPATDHGFAALFLLTMAGNVGLLLAADAVSFYAMFTLMTFAAYGLVVHTRSASALRAGRVYIALAVLGEVAIFSGLALAVHAAGSTEMALLGEAVAVAPDREVIVALVLVGFGVKAGVVPLHLWLPLAHPAAPVAASAVLSGTMIKAGMVGWLRVLPLGEAALPGWSLICIAVGLLTAFAGVAIGLTQRDAKTNLAYSSISQMGIITVLVGVALDVPEGSSLAVTAAVVYALHHGFAKAALFLGVGVVRAESDPRRHRLALAGMGLAALSLAGLPLTSGALAKLSLKDAVGLLSQQQADAITLALSLAAVGTTMLMGRLLLLLSRPAAEGSARPDTVAPWTVVLVAVALATWALPAALLPQLDRPTIDAGSLWEGLWPVVVGAALVAAGWQVHRRTGAQVPAIPAGDAVFVVEWTAHGIALAWRRHVAPNAAAAAARLVAAREAVAVATRPGGGVDSLDQRLTRWRTAGALFIALTTVLLSLLLVELT